MPINEIRRTKNRSMKILFISESYYIYVSEVIIRIIDEILQLD